MVAKQGVKVFVLSPIAKDNPCPSLLGRLIFWLVKLVLLCKRRSNDYNGACGNSGVTRAAGGVKEGGDEFQVWTSEF